MGKKLNFIKINAEKFSAYKDFLKSQAKKLHVSYETVIDYVLHNQKTQKYKDNEKFLNFYEDWKKYLSKNDIIRNTATNWTRLDEYKIVKGIEYKPGFKEKVIKSFADDELSLNEIAKKFKISFSQVCNIIYRNTNRQTKEDLFANRNANILKDIDSGMMMKNVAAKYGLNYTHVYHINTVFRNKIKEAPEYLDDVIKKYNSGSTIKSMADSLNKPKTALYYQILIYCKIGKNGKLSRRKLPK